MRLRLILEDLSNLTRTYCTATLTDSELETLSHSNWSDQSNVDSYVVTRHYHLNSLWQLNLTSYVHCTEVELRTILVVEWSVTATFFLLEDVDLSLEVSVWSYRTWLAENHTTLNLVLIDTTEEKTNVITSLTLIEELTEHLNTCYNSQLVSAKTEELNLITDVNDTCLDTASSNCTTTCDREDILDWHKEWLIESTWRELNPLITSSHKFHNLILPLSNTIECTESRTEDEWSLILETILRKKITHIHLNELEHFLILNLVALVNKYNETWNVYLTIEEDVLTSLWHRTISSSNYDDSTIHLSSTSNHVLYIVSVARTVNVCIVTVSSLILYVSSIDSDTTLLLFWSVVDLVERLNLICVTSYLFSKYLGDCGSKSSLTVVNVADSTDVDMRFGSLESFFCHNIMF